MIRNKTITSAEADLSRFDFAQWRINEVLYVKSVDTENGLVFEVHAADGTYLDEVTTMAEAQAAAFQNEMELEPVH